MISFEFNNKVYKSVTLTPPETIICPYCGKDVTTTSRVCISPAIHVYICSCGEKLEIQEDYTISHWPEEIRVAFKKQQVEWVNNGMPIKEVQGQGVYNKLGIAKIDIDKSDYKI